MLASNVRKSVKGHFAAAIMRAAAMAAMLMMAATVIMAQDAAASRSAAPTAAKPAAEAPAIPADSVVFVPYDAMKGPEWGLDQSVLVPYAEFLKLKSQAQDQPDDPAFQPRATISQAVYEGALSGDVAVLDAVITIDVLARAKDKLDILLPFGASAIERVEVRSESSVKPTGQPNALAISARDTLGPLEGRPGLALRLDGPGRREVHLRLAVPVATDGAVKVLRFEAPAAGAASLRVHVAEDVVIEQREGSLPARVSPANGGGFDISASAGAWTVYQVAWRPKIERTEAAAQVRLSATQGAIWTLGSQIASGQINLKFQVLAGEAESVAVKMPAGLQLIGVTGPFVKDWSAPDADGRVAVQLVRPATGEIQLNLQVQAAAEGERFAVPEVSAPDAVRQSGQVVIRPEAGLAVWPEEMTGLEAVSVGSGGSGDRAFQFSQPGWTLALSRRAIPARVRAEGLLLYEVTEDVIRLKAQHQLTVSGRGVFDVTLEAPEGFDLREAGPPDLVAGFRQEGRRLQINLRTEQRDKFMIETQMHRARQEGDGASTLEPLSVVGAEEEFGFTVLAAPLALRVTETQARGLDATDVRALQPRLQPMMSPDIVPVLGYRYFEPKFRAVAAIERQRARQTCETELLASIQPSLLRMDAYFNFNVEYSATDTFQVLLPAAAGDDVRFSGADIKERVRSNGQTPDGLTTWTLRLQRRMLGAVTIVASFDQPLPEAAAGKPVALAVPQARATGVARESGHVAVSRGENLEVRVAKSDGLEPRDVKELPGRLSSAFLGFRYFDPAAVTLDVELIRHELAEVLGALIRRLHIETVLSDQREVTHEVYMEVQNNSEQYLELSLPKTMEIWSAFVRGVPVRVTTRASDGANLIEIVKSETMDKAFRVRLIIKETLPGGALGMRGSVAFAPPAPLNMPVQRTTWKLFLPRGYRYVDFGGDMRLEEGGRAPWIEPAAESLLSDLPADLAGGIAKRMIQPPVAQSGAQYSAQETEEEKQARLRTGSALDIEIVKEGAQFLFSKLSGVGAVEVHYWKRKPLVILQGGLALVIVIAMIVLVWGGRRLIAGLGAVLAAFIGASLAEGFSGRLLATAFAAAGAGLAIGGLMWLAAQMKKSAKEKRERKPVAPPPSPPVYTEAFTPLAPPKPETDKPGAPQPTPPTDKE